MWPLHFILYVGFLSTEVWRVPSSLDVIRIPKTGMVPSVMENSILWLMELRCSRKLFLSCFLMIVCVCVMDISFPKHWC